MATRKKKRPAKKPTFEPKDARAKPVWAVFLLMLALLVAVSLADYDPSQKHTTDAVDHNLAGKLGVNIAFYSYRVLGAAAWLLPIYILWGSYMLCFSQSHKVKPLQYLAIAISLCTAAPIITGMMPDEPRDPNFYIEGYGGWIGTIIFSRALLDSVGIFGSYLGLGGLFVFANLFILWDNLGKPLRFIPGKFKKWREGQKASADDRKEAAGPEDATRLKDAEKDRKKLPKGIVPPAKIPGRPPSGPPTVPQPLKSAPAGAEAQDKVKTVTPLDADVEPPIDDGQIVVPKIIPQKERPEPEPARTGSAAQSKLESSGSSRTSGTGELTIIAGEKAEKATAPLPERRGDYRFPNVSLLTEQLSETEGNGIQDHRATAEGLVSTLAEFGVKVTMGEVHTGPVITRYDVHPAPGVRVEKIVNLDKNIALGLKANSVRILAPVPGKGCVGIEVPNEKPLEVSLREILESRNWVECDAEIPIVLGREVSGKPLIADLTKMPHLLIAGATGSGKTVCINTIVASLLYHSGPDDLRFVMIDPKIVEMQAFNELPHMLIPVVTDPKKVPGALKYLLKEMENRYQIFAKEGVRNIAGFNAKSANEAKDEIEQRELEANLSPEERAAVSTVEVPRDAEIEVPDKLPYIVCVIDELADLMMVAPQDIETCIARLAQLARAAGIHLIIATQRPSVNVITGVIKANLPSRIAFKVASKVDSRTILDAMGADHLIGRGDMLFLPPGTADLVRAQGAFVEDDEIKAIVDFLKANGPPKFDEQFQATVESAGGPDAGDDGDDGEELLPDAVEVLRSTKRASTSMLQRRLRIGYNRAARIMEILEARGIVGPENGAQPREILKNLDVL